MGRVGFAFAPRNEFGVLDHEVTLPSGEVFYNPMRVVPDGEACEVVFTLRQQQGMTDESSSATRPLWRLTSRRSSACWNHVQPRADEEARAARAQHGVRDRRREPQAPLTFQSPAQLCRQNRQERTDGKEPLTFRVPQRASLCSLLVPGRSLDLSRY
jgi:hypothetical protein